jgi:hypothetical protein
MWVYLLLCAQLHEGLEVDNHLAVHFDEVIVFDTVLQELHLLAAVRGLIPCDLVLKIGVLIAFLSIHWKREG